MPLLSKIYIWSIMFEPLLYFVLKFAAHEFPPAALPNWQGHKSVDVWTIHKNSNKSTPFSSFFRMWLLHNPFSIKWDHYKPTI
mgnify:CR=1 FL=1